MPAIEYCWMIIWKVMGVTFPHSCYLFTFPFAKRLNISYFQSGLAFRKVFGARASLWDSLLMQKADFAKGLHSFIA
jgi:hypothetical protein